MKCPNCNETLLMTERNSIEIDYCPSCRGVWLDKGELDKMLIFAEKNHSASYSEHNYFHDSGQDKNYSTHQQRQQRSGKKKSFLGDLFEFD